MGGTTGGEFTERPQLPLGLFALGIGTRQGCILSEVSRALTQLVPTMVPIVGLGHRSTLAFQLGDPSAETIIIAAQGTTQQASFAETPPDPKIGLKEPTP
ncbi:MAG: hypothetical protein EBR70_01150 [Verrucomicrobia bacterium]|nr:hypothetical protein [Verrucomicrobiota bacterium]